MQHARDDLRAKLSDSKPPEIKSKAIESLREVSALLAAKAPGDFVAFKDWLRQISQRTADAATEGGLLRFSGVAVSEAEKGTLADIASALGS